MDWRAYIAITPGIRSGKPHLAGTRITVQDVLEYLAGGDTPEGLGEAFPELTPERIRACLAFAAIDRGGAMESATRAMDAVRGEVPFPRET